MDPLQRFVDAVQTLLLLLEPLTDSQRVPGTEIHCRVQDAAQQVVKTAAGVKQWLGEFRPPSRE